jgi:alkyl hydroperoxide reductase subunit AhpF
MVAWADAPTLTGGAPKSRVWARPRQAERCTLEFDVIVVGGGHAGTEVALAAARAWVATRRC